MLIDLGGGTLPHPRADIVIDLHHPMNAPAQDAAVIPWHGNISPRQHNVSFPLQDGVAHEVYSSHFMEHVPRGQPLINVMNEAWRVLKPGGTYTMIFPIIGYTDPTTGNPQSNHIGWQPWADPTHVNYWWMPEGLHYFTGGPWSAHADYGIKAWEPIATFLDEHTASDELATYHRTNTQRYPSFWSIRSGWEALCRMRKP